MPIEALAQAVGMTVRNLRALHARGILQPPELVGRKGFYTQRHVARALLVLKLQGRGFSLSAIAELLRSWEQGGGLMELMGLEDALVESGAGSPALEVDVAAEFPELLSDAGALAMAVRQKLVVPKAGRYVAPNAELLRIVKQEVAEGLPLRHLLREGDALLADVARIVARFRDSFFTHVVNPHLEAGAPASGRVEVAAKVERLRPLAARLVSLLVARELAQGGGPEAGAAANARTNANAGAKTRTKATPTARVVVRARGKRKTGARGPQAKKSARRPAAQKRTTRGKRR